MQETNICFGKKVTLNSSIGFGIYGWQIATSIFEKKQSVHHFMSAESAWCGKAEKWIGAKGFYFLLVTALNLGKICSNNKL